MEALINSKRLIILDAKTCSPVTAYKIADISMCYGLNTAGIIAGLHESIHWDCTGWLKYPLYKESKQQLFYSSLKKLNEAIKKSTSGDNTIGDFRCLRKILTILMMPRIWKEFSFHKRISG